MNEAETYVAELISKINLTKSTDGAQVSRDVRAAWNHPTIRKRGIRWIEPYVTAAKKRLPKLRLVK